MKKGCIPQIFGAPALRARQILQLGPQNRMLCYCATRGRDGKEGEGQREGRCGNGDCPTVISKS